MGATDPVSSIAKALPNDTPRHARPISQTGIFVADVPAAAARVNVQPGGG
jgi:hypothetical protein